MSANTFPSYRGRMEYVCLGCGARFGIDELHYTCPTCGGVFLLTDTTFDSLKRPAARTGAPFSTPAPASKNPALRGVFRFYELMAPLLDEQVHSVPWRRQHAHRGFAPSPARRRARPQDRVQERRPEPQRQLQGPGHGLPFSFLKSLIRRKGWTDVLATAPAPATPAPRPRCTRPTWAGAVKARSFCPPER
jgi:threonine synthase